MAFPWAAAIAGAASIGSNIYSGISSNNQNKKLAAQQNQYNQQLQQRAFDYNTQQSQLEYERNLEQWNRENQYNTPAAQMQRYIDAGLNPNLIYGSGSSAGVSASSPQYSAAQYTAPKAERATNRPVHSIDPYQAVSLGNQLALQRAQVDNLEAQADYTRNQSADISLRNSITASKQFAGYYDNEIALQRAQLSQIRSNVEFQRARKDLLPHQEELLKQTLKNMRTQNDIDRLNYELAKIGVNNGDDLWQRIAARLFINFRNKSDRNSFINKLFE